MLWWGGARWEVGYRSVPGDAGVPSVPTTPSRPCQHLRPPRPRPPAPAPAPTGAAVPRHEAGGQRQAGGGRGRRRGRSEHREWGAEGPRRTGPRRAHHPRPPLSPATSPPRPRALCPALRSTRRASRLPDRAGRVRQRRREPCRPCRHLRPQQLHPCCRPGCAVLTCARLQHSRAGRAVQRCCVCSLARDGSGGGGGRGSSPRPWCPCRRGGAGAGAAAGGGAAQRVTWRVGHGAAARKCAAADLA